MSSPTKKKYEGKPLTTPLREEEIATTKHSLGRGGVKPIPTRNAKPYNGTPPVNKSKLTTKKATKPADQYPKQYVNETWGSRSEWKTMSGRQSGINKSNKN